MKTIWKKELPLDGDGFFEIQCPLDAEFKHVALQSTSPSVWTPCVWYECSSDLPMKSFQFRWIATGELIGKNPIDYMPWQYIGTILSPPNGAFVFHLYLNKNIKF